MIILLANLIVAVILVLIDAKFVISFEVAFVGAMFVFYSSYKAVAKKISDYGVIMGLNSVGIDSIKDSVDLSKHNCDLQNDLTDSRDLSADSPKAIDNLPKKERLFIGFKVSFGLLRLLSYAFIALSIIVLINNNIFFLIPFLLGIIVSTISSAFYAMKKSNLYRKS